MRRLRNWRDHKLELVLTALLAGSIVAGGVVAVIVDTLESVDNDVTTGTFNAAPGTDIIAAVFSGTADNCDTATYDEDDLLPAVMTGAAVEVGVNAGVSSTNYICVKNNSTGTGDLLWSIPSFADLELGACEPSESSAGDTTCNDGDEGEASAFVIVRPGLYTGSGTNQSPNCISGSFTALDSASTPMPLTNAPIAAGTYCRYEIQAMFPSAASTDTEKAIAQTDTVLFTIRFHLDDGT